ncbi:retropepsin-like aspartic protease, partial [Candidatus Burkholderia verschuerenii]|uniref:retropepsin-like aspartic protease n=1 Tax=Candidatus Burkholderia verschuerenii TaxID=242163 RepID=UPI0018DE6E06
MKDMLSNKGKQTLGDIVTLSPNCSCIIKKDLRIPTKEKDPGSCTIPVAIGDKKFAKALCDLGSGVSLMPLSIAKNLKLVDGLKYTPVALQLADKSIVRPDGILEDILVQVDKYFLPTDFMVFDMQEDLEVPLILGRPFLATGDAIIRVKDNEITFNINGEEVRFKVDEAVKYPGNYSECFHVDVLESLVMHTTQEMIAQETWLKQGVELHFDSEDATIERLLCESIENCYLDDLAYSIMGEDHGKDESDELNEDGSLEQALSLGETTIDENTSCAPMEEVLKPLPSNLKYAFLGDNQTLPVITSSTLGEDQELQLTNLLKECKRAIGWTMADIKGIRPLVCTHKIFLEEDHKPVRQKQRRLNPLMLGGGGGGVFRLL